MGEELLGYLKTLASARPADHPFGEAGKNGRKEPKNMISF